MSIDYRKIADAVETGIIRGHVALDERRARNYLRHRLPTPVSLMAPQKPIADVVHLYGVSHEWAEQAVLSLQEEFAANEKHGATG